MCSWKPFCQAKKSWYSYCFINKYTTAGYHLGLGCNSDGWHSNWEQRQLQGESVTSANRDTAGREGEAFWPGYALSFY